MKESDELTGFIKSRNHRGRIELFIEGEGIEYELLGNLLLPLSGKKVTLTIDYSDTDIKSIKFDL